MNNRSRAVELAPLIGPMERAMKELGAPEMKNRDAFMKFQYNQIMHLLELERKFKKRLLASKKGAFVYQSFIKHIDTLPSILSARSFFKERDGAFKDTLRPAVESNDWRAIAQYDINYRFVRWALSLGVLDGTFHTIGRYIAKQRNEMLLLLMPLGISRARIFYNNTPTAHLSLHDFCNIKFEGFLVGIDKFVPPVRMSQFDVVSKYRSTALGRATGSAIENFSETSVRFTSADKKILYRANKIVGKTLARIQGLDFDAMATKLSQDSQKDLGGGFRVSGGELSDMMLAASPVSSDAIVSTKKMVTRLESPHNNPEQEITLKDGVFKIRSAAKNLTMIERKFLILKGMLPVEDITND